MTTTLTAAAVPADELTALARLKNSLPIDSELGRVLGKIADGLGAGSDVFVAETDESLTPTQAAKLLGVSRTHFYKALDGGAVPFHVVGERDRRILVADFIAYRERVMSARSDDAMAIARRTELENAVFDAM